VHVIDHLDSAARNFPGRRAFGGAGGDVTYAEARTTSIRIARALRDTGFEPGTPFAVLSPNDSRTMVAMLGAMRAGGAWCNVNLAAATELNVDLLRRGRCAVLFFHSSAADQVPAFLAGIESLRLVVCIDSAATAHPSLASWCAGFSTDHLDLVLDPAGLGCQGVTGGTTGLPKIAQGSNEFLQMSTLVWATCWHFDEPPVNLAIAPITHAGGMIALAQFQFGGTTICMAKPDLAAVLDLIQAERVTTLFLPPTLIYRLLGMSELANRDLSSLRYVISAAAPISAERIMEAVERLGPVVCQAYGQTEAGFPLTWMSPGEVVAAIKASDDARLLSCGRPTAICTALEAMDPAGRVLAAGESGEIVLRGPTTMIGYLDDPDATAAVQAFGWHHTGDIGHRDEEGYVFITDRVRDVVISGGFNVFPFEVEQALLTHPSVLDCAVIGVPSEEWGEQVHACVELRPGGTASEEELVRHAKQIVGSIKAPKSVEFVGELPRSPVGKVLKRTLREPHWANRARAVN
jgi:acyl-CoA synthetase (AMP-forming)/AMP-acid ligase II